MRKESSKRVIRVTQQILVNEELVGKAIRESGIPRSEIYLVTKLSYVLII